MCSTCFGHKYIHHQELATILLNYHIGRIVLGSMCVGVSVWLGCSGIRVAGKSSWPKRGINNFFFLVALWPTAGRGPPPLLLGFKNHTQ